MCEQSTGPASQPGNLSCPAAQTCSLSLSSPPPPWPSCWGSGPRLTSRIEPLPVTGSPTAPRGPREQQWLRPVNSEFRALRHLQGPGYLGLVRGPAHPNSSPAHPSSHPRMPGAPACPRESATGHHLPYLERSRRAEADRPGEGAGVEEAPATEGSQGKRTFRRDGVGEGLRAAGVLPKWWNTGDPTPCRAEARESPGDVEDVGAWGRSQSRLRWERLREAGGGSG